MVPTLTWGLVLSKAVAYPRKNCCWPLVVRAAAMGEVWGVRRAREVRKKVRASDMVVVVVVLEEADSKDRKKQ